MSNMLIVDRETKSMFPMSLEDKIPAEHLVRKVVDFCTQLNLELFHVRTVPGGEAQFDPRDVLALLIYGYIEGFQSSRQMEWLSRDSRAGEYIFGDRRWIDHTTICRYISNNLEAFAELLVRSLEDAHARGYLEARHAIVDGTKIRAYASANQRRSLCYGDYSKHRSKLKQERTKLVSEASKLLQSTAGGSVDEKDLGRKCRSLYKQIVRLDRDLKSLEEAKRNVEVEAKKKRVGEILPK